MSDEGAYFDIVEVGAVDEGRDSSFAAIPSYFEVREAGAGELGEGVDAEGIGVAAHEAHAGDVGQIMADEGVEGVGGEGVADVVPEILAMASWAMAGAVGDVDREGHLVGDFLEDDTRVNIFEH